MTRPTRIAWMVAACCLSAFCWLLVGLGVQSALGAYEPAEQVRLHAQRILRVPLPDRPVVLGDPEVMRTCGGYAENLAKTGGAPCDGLAWPDRIEVSVDLLLDLDVGGGEAVIGALHEHLHKPEGDPTNLDEGVITALAIDLCPAVRYAVFGIRGPCGAWGYEAETAGVRMASARATGAHWRSRVARDWRRALWFADHEGRQAIWAGAWS